MKRFLAVSAILAVTSAQATELKFGDLNYFFKQNQANVGVDITTTTYQFNNAGSKREKEGYQALARFNVGFTDNLYVSLDVNYDQNMKTTGNGRSYTEDGFTSPRLGLNYRLLQQDTYGMNLDFGAFYKMASLKESTRGANGLDGNASSARDSVEVNVRLGNKWNEANEFYLLAGAIHNLDGDFDQKGGVTTDQDSSNDYYLGAFYQYRPVNEFMLSVGGTATKYSEIKNKPAGLASFNTEDHTDMKLHFRAKYLITESMIANFNYSQSNLPDYKEGAAKINRRHAHSIGLGIDFLF